MTPIEASITPPPRTRLGYAYLLTGIALFSIFVSGVLGSIFTPELITTSGTSGGGYIHQQVPLAAYMGWVFDVIAIWMVLPTAMKGIRAKVTERAPWTLFGLGVSGIWLAVMFISMFAPRVVSGTAPWLTWTPVASIISVVAGLILTGLLCKTVRTASFESATSQTVPEMGVRSVSGESAGDEAAARLRRLAQLRDSGVITSDDFEERKRELLHQV
jgi:hypothetical protein